VATFGGYDSAAILKAQQGTLLWVADGFATTAEWVAVSQPDSPEIYSADGYAASNRVGQIHRFRCCQHFVKADSVNLHWGMHVDGANGDGLLLHDPQTGNVFQIRQAYYLAFVAEGDILLPVYFGTGGTYAIVVKGADSPTVAAVVHIGLHAGRLDSVLRIGD
jgi:hypothetical protein